MGRWTPIAAIALLAVASVGCGDDPDPQIATPTPTDAVEAPPASAVETDDGAESDAAAVAHDDEQDPERTLPHDDEAQHPAAESHETETAHADEKVAHDEAVQVTEAPPVAADEPDTPDGIVVEVEMTEFAYDLDATSVPAGEPVTFRFVNIGQIEHEAMIGTRHQQDEFAASDDHGDHGGGDSGGHHGDVAAITLGAGEAGELTTMFDTPGEFWIGCHISGHWDAGMWSTFVVEA